MNVKRKCLILVIGFISTSIIFPEKVTDYVNKKDVETGNRIFLFKAEPENRNNNRNAQESIKGESPKGITGNPEINADSADKENIKSVENKVGEIDLEYR